MITNHIFDYCSMCGLMVTCATCNNNCCNGMYGEINGEKCVDCPDAYLIQSKFFDNPFSVTFKNATQDSKDKLKEWVDNHKDWYGVYCDEINRWAHSSMD